MSRSLPIVLVLVLASLLAPAAAEEGAGLPVIVGVTAPARLAVGTQGELRVAYRAPEANVVAVLQVVEDREASGGRRATRQRELSVVARAFGRESGELPVPLSFVSPGWKRVTLTLVTDERAQSDPFTVEVEATP